MPNIERYENLVIGSGGAGKFIAWTMPARAAVLRWLNVRHLAEHALMSPVFPARTSSTPPRSQRLPGVGRNSA
jgi:hypothetical protein